MTDPTIEHMATLLRLRAATLGTAVPATAEPPKTAPPPSGLPTPPPGPQTALPGIEAPARVRRSATHRFGLLRRVEVPGTALDEAHTEERETCRHCPCERRRANTGARMGAQVTYSTDGQAWSLVSPPCIPKARRT